MVIDRKLLDSLTEQAKKNPRLRQAFDLRTQASSSGQGLPQDQSQRILNAVEPGTVLPIHRHRGSTETIVCLRGKCVQHIYEQVDTLENQVKKVDSIYLEPNTDVVAMSVEVGQWHKLESLESGTVILECKNGRYEPLSEEDILC